MTSYIAFEKFSIRVADVKFLSLRVEKVPGGPGSRVRPAERSGQLHPTLVLPPLIRFVDRSRDAKVMPRESRLGPPALFPRAAFPITGDGLRRRMASKENDSCQQKERVACGQLLLGDLNLFASSPFQSVSLDQEWWKGVAGEQPDDFLSTRKRESREDKGSFQGALLSLTVAFTRIVWEARPPAVVDQSGNFPTFEEPFPDKLKWFVELLKPWLTASCPPLLRLAFSAKLLRPAASAELAYRDLQTQLPIVNLESDPNDFLGIAMTVVQAFDGVIGALAHDPAKTCGPFAFAILNALAVGWLLRGREGHPNRPMSS